MPQKPKPDKFPNFGDPQVYEVGAAGFWLERWRKALALPLELETELVTAEEFAELPL